VKALPLPLPSDTVACLVVSTVVKIETKACATQCCYGGNNQWGRGMQTKKRYCFVCKKTTKHGFCDNCSTYFCQEHCEWEKDTYYGKHVLYPLHKRCR